MPHLWRRAGRERAAGRVIAIDMRKPARDNWKEIIPEAKENLAASAWSAICSSPIISRMPARRSSCSAWTARSSAKSSSPASARPSGFGGKRTRHRDVLLVFQLRHAAEHLPLRSDDRQKQADPPGRR